MHMPTLQPINPDAPNVFNGIAVSYGVAPILGAISDMSRSSKRKTWTNKFPKTIDIWGGRNYNAWCL